MPIIKLAVSGARGRMGQRIIALARKDSDFEVVCAVERDDHPDLGKTIDELFITCVRAGFADCDCIIDFSYPKAVLDNAVVAFEFKKSLVIGTTGLDREQQEKIAEASQTIPIVLSPNMSVGVNALFRMLNEAAQGLRGYRISIQEPHQNH